MGFSPQEPRVEQSRRVIQPKTAMTPTPFAARKAARSTVEPTKRRRQTNIFRRKAPPKTTGTIVETSAFALISLFLSGGGASRLDRVNVFSFGRRSFARATTASPSRKTQAEPNRSRADAATWVWTSTVFYPPPTTFSARDSQEFRRKRRRGVDIERFALERSQRNILRENFLIIVFDEVSNVKDQSSVFFTKRRIRRSFLSDVVLVARFTVEVAGR